MQVSLWIAAADSLCVSTSASERAYRKKADSRLTTGGQGSIGIFLLKYGSDLEKDLFSSASMIGSITNETSPISLIEPLNHSKTN